MSTPEANRGWPVLEHLAGGLITLLIGLAFLAVSRGFAVLAIPGAICAAVGAGLLVVACCVCPFVRRHGQAS